jgi:hypothetical protein
VLHRARLVEERQRGAGGGQVARGWWRRAAVQVRTELPMLSTGLVAVNGGVGQDEERRREASRGEPVWDCWRTGGTGLMAAAWVMSSSELPIQYGKMATEVAT